MEIKIKIIEFSSDVFSKSNQLKDIIISPLFSKTNFSINIFEAISKNEEYKFKAHTPIIKIGLFNGKSLLGVGKINTHKNSQKIKITLDDKNKGNKFLNGAYDKLQNNAYYLTLECISNNLNNGKNTSLEINKKRRKKNSSVDIHDKKNYLGFNPYIKDKRLNKDFDLGEKKNNSVIINSDIKEENSFYLNSNSTVIKNESHNLTNNAFYSNDINENKPINKIDNFYDEKESNNNIFNLSFKKELFSDGVLNLTNDNNNNNYNNNINTKIDKENIDIEGSNQIEINDFNNLINEFNLVYNNVRKNNTFSGNNIKDNFLLEYQYFLEKGSDIFKLYSKFSYDIRKQNENIKEYINNYINKIKIIYKKNKILKIKSQNLEMNEFFGNKKVKKQNEIYNNEIKNISNKLSIIKIIDKEYLNLTKNKFNQQKYKILLKDIFKQIIQNEDIRENLKDYSNIISLLLKNKKLSNNKEKINSENNKIDNFEENKERSKIDLEKLKNKIDKLKEQYLNENNTKENKFKIKNNKEKKKKIVTKTYPSFMNLGEQSNRGTNIENKDRNINYFNAFTPNGEERNKITKKKYNYFGNYL